MSGILWKIRGFFEIFGPETLEIVVWNFATTIMTEKIIKPHKNLQKTDKKISFKISKFPLFFLRKI
jgi:hypothetical protein